MKNIWNSVKFNGILVKPFWKYYMIILVLAVGMSRILSQDSVIFFLVIYLIMTLSYPFQLEEKQNGARLYGLIPFKRSALVMGRYLFAMLIGFFAVFIGLLIEIITRRFANQPFFLRDIMGSTFIALGMFAALAAITLPGYYKFGTIKGRWFMFVPMMLFFSIAAAVERIPALGALLHFLVSNVWLIAVIPVLMYIVSLWLSIRVFEAKEL